MDLVVCADTVHTMGGDSGVTAVAMRAGRIEAVGSRADVAAWRTAGTQVIDLGAAVIVPGLVDSHSHPVTGAIMVRGVSLTGLDLAEARAAVAGEVASTEGGDWVLASGLDPNVVPDGQLTAAHFDDVVGGRPAFIRLFDGHSALATTEALRRAGVDGPRRFDQEAEIVCDASGRPTGLLLEPAAMASVADHLPEMGLDEHADAVAEVLRSMASVGLTGLHAMEHVPGASAVLALLEERGDLPIRMRCSPWCTPGSDAADWEAIRALQGTGGRRWAVEGVKMFMDGTIDNGTAWLEQPDTLGESTKPFWPDPRAFSEALAWFDRHGVPTATHAIGDQAVRHVLDAIEAGGRSVRHRIEHIETLPDDLVARFSDLGVAASMQPTHCTEYTRSDATDNWSRRLGPERTSHGWRLRDLRDGGVRVAIGSDWPIAESDPRGILAAARLRRRGGAPDREPITPEQALTAAMALEGYTSHAAWSVGHDDVAGTIEPGRLADLTALGLDPLTAPADELVDAPVRLTVVDGTVQHHA